MIPHRPGNFQHLVGWTAFLEDFWGKAEAQAVADLQSTNGPIAGAVDVELVVDPYYPNTVPTAPSGFGGHTIHAGVVVAFFSTATRSLSRTRARRCREEL